MVIGEAQAVESREPASLREWWVGRSSEPVQGEQDVGQGLIARESWGPEPRTGMVFSCFAGIGGQESQGPGHRREQAPPWCLATIL